MKSSDLLSPGTLRISQKLRILAAQAVSAYEIRTQNGGTDTKIGAFFKDCATKAGALVAGAAQVANGRLVSIINSAGTGIGLGTAVVANSDITGLQLPSTATLVAHNQKVTGVTVTGTGSVATFTVVNGVVTGIVLSAS